MIERKLTVSEVSINQVAVEIKVLKIGNRQVTLAVFRQLPEEDIIDFDTGELRGVPWGWVNYHFDGCNDRDRYPGHRHIIWQKEGELRRATIGSQRPDRGRIYKLECEIDRWAETFIAARILEGWIPETTSSDGEPLIPSPINIAFNTSHGQQPIKVYLGDLIRKAWYKASRWNDSARKYEEDDFWSLSDYKRGEITRRYFAGNLPCDSQRLYDEYVVPALEEQLPLTITYVKSRVQLMELEQLFIAV